MMREQKAPGFFYPFRPSFLGKSNGALKSKSLDRNFKAAKYRIKIDGPGEKLFLSSLRIFFRGNASCVCSMGNQFWKII